MKIFGICIFGHKEVFRAGCYRYLECRHCGDRIAERIKAGYSAIDRDWLNHKED